MEDFDALVKVVDLGATGVLVAILFALWRAFTEQNQFIREMLLRGELDRAALQKMIRLNSKRIAHIGNEPAIEDDSE